MEIQLDEIQWRLPQAVEFYRGIHTDSVHLYFMNSPFFDPTSNNGVLRQQSELNPGMQYLLRSRADFEHRLRTMQGLEFLVVEEPQQRPDGQDTGIWVIRKQERRKRAGREDELTVLGSYFVVGEDIYQAPSLGDVIRNRLLSVTTNLASLLSLTSSLPRFSPADGYSYLPPITQDPSTSHPPSASRSTTPTPSTDPFHPSASTAPADEKSDLSLLWDSFQLATRHATEFANENPLRGEPGGLVFSATADHLASQSSTVARSAPSASQRSMGGATASFVSGGSTPTGPAGGSRMVTPVPLAGQGAGGKGRTGSAPGTPGGAGGAGKAGVKKRKS